MPTLVVAFCGASAAAISPEHWREDIRFLAKELPARHKNAFFQTPKARFDAEAGRILDSLSTATDLQVRAALVKLVASLGDGHTRIDAMAGGRSYPIAFRVLPDGIYVIATMPEHTSHLGARLVAIQSTPVAEVQAKMEAYVPRENRASLMADLPGWLSRAGALQAEGITDGGSADFHLERNGVRYSVRLEPSEKPALTQAPAGTKLPVSRSRVGSDYRDYWSTYLPEARALYIQYNACRNMKDQPFSDFVREAMALADREGAAKYVVDLRGNGGGDSRVIGPLVRALANRRAPVYALVGRNTFSSGFWAAQELKQKAHAVLVGEAMGQKPNSYGEVRSFQLPNSRLAVRYSTKYWRRLKHSDPDQLEPDVPVVLRPSDLLAYRDPVLDYVLAQRK